MVNNIENNLTKFQESNSIKNHLNIIEVTQSQELKIYTYSNNFFGKIERFFNHWIWKSEKRNFHNVANHLQNFYEKEIDPNKKNLSIDQLKRIQQTLEIINDRWKKVKNRMIPKRLEIAEEEIKKLIDDKEKEDKRNPEVEIKKLNKTNPLEKQDKKSKPNINQKDDKSDLDQENQGNIAVDRKKLDEINQMKKNLKSTGIHNEAKEPIEMHPELKPNALIVPQKDPVVNPIELNKPKLDENKPADTKPNDEKPANIKEESDKVEVNQKIETPKIDLPAIEGKDKKEKTSVTIREGFLSYLKTEQNVSSPERAKLFETLIVDQKRVEKEIHSSPVNVILSATIFGDEIFRKKKFINFPIEGPGSERAIWTFLEGLADYYDSMEINLSKEQKENFKEIFDAYYTFQISALIRRKIKSAPKGCDRNKWIALGKEILQRDIEDVKNGRKKRGYWLAGSNDHFVPLRYEKLSDGRFIAGTFNLGGGVNDSHVNKKENKIISETRIADDSFNSTELEHFCQNIVENAALCPLSVWVFFINVQSKSIEERKQDLLSYVPEQHQQWIGDCTCRGQWALLKKDFGRLFPQNQEINYQNFKHFLRKEKLKILRPDQPIPISLGIDKYDVFVNEKNLINENVTKDQLYQICWRHYYRLPVKKADKRREKNISHEEKWKGIEMTFPNLFTKYSFSLGDLFGDDKKVILGREPDYEGLSNETQYYRIPNLVGSTYRSISRVALILNRNEQNEIIVTVNQFDTLTVTTKDKKEIVYEKGEYFILTSDIETMQISDFVVELNSLS